MEVVYDLQNGRHITSSMTNEKNNTYDFNHCTSTSDYTPGALRGVRERGAASFPGISLRASAGTVP